MLVDDDSFFVFKGEASKNVSRHRSYGAEFMGRLMVEGRFGVRTIENSTYLGLVGNYHSQMRTMVPEYLLT